MHPDSRSHVPKSVVGLRQQEKATVWLQGQWVYPDLAGTENPQGFRAFRGGLNHEARDIEPWVGC